MVNDKAIGMGVKGKARVQILRIHQLLEFERAFTAYLEGKASADHVTARAKKILPFSG